MYSIVLFQFITELPGVILYRGVKYKEYVRVLGFCFSWGGNPFQGDQSDFYYIQRGINLVSSLFGVHVQLLINLYVINFQVNSCIKRSQQVSTSK